MQLCLQLLNNLFDQGADTSASANLYGSGRLFWAMGNRADADIDLRNAYWTRVENHIQTKGELKLAGQGMIHNIAASEHSIHDHVTGYGGDRIYLFGTNLGSGRFFDVFGLDAEVSHGGNVTHYAQLIAGEVAQNTLRNSMMTDTDWGYSLNNSFRVSDSWLVSHPTGVSYNRFLESGDHYYTFDRNSFFDGDTGPSLEMVYAGSFDSRLEDYGACESLPCIETLGQSNYFGPTHTQELQGATLGVSNISFLWDAADAADEPLFDFSTYAMTPHPILRIDGPMLAQASLLNAGVTLKASVWKGEQYVAEDAVYEWVDAMSDDANVLATGPEVQTYLVNNYVRVMGTNGAYSYAQHEIANYNEHPLDVSRPPRASSHCSVCSPPCCWTGSL